MKQPKSLWITRERGQLADYKRFVSYMYEYENGDKRKNVGYARVETRNGECRFTMRMQLEGIIDGIFPTYLIHRPQAEMNLVYIGDCSVKNQVMDSRLSAKEKDVMDSGHRFSEMGGLLLFSNSGVFYATQWDDKPVVLEEVLGALKPKSNSKTPAIDVDNIGNEQETVPTQKSNKNNEIAQISQEGADNIIKAADQAYIDQTNTEQANTEQKYADKNNANYMSIDINPPVYMLPRGWKTKEGALHVSAKAPINPWELVERYKRHESELSKTIDITSRMDILKNTSSEEVDIIKDTRDGKDEVNNNPMLKNDPAKEVLKNESHTNRSAIKPLDDELQGKKSDESKDVKNIDGNKDNRGWQGKEVAKEEQQKENSLLAKIFTSFPRIYPFEDNEITRCVKIEPKDIGSLPSETWILSNNSFLLHGYYCYHHLIFAEIIDSYGSHYILGIPGIYHNREQFMARMFGFECFKSIRKRELKQGDFGYWYLEVNI